MHRTDSVDFANYNINKRNDVEESAVDCVLLNSLWLSGASTDNTIDKNVIVKGLFEIYEQRKLKLKLWNQFVDCMEWDR